MCLRPTNSGVWEDGEQTLPPVIVNVLHGSLRLTQIVLPHFVGVPPKEASFVLGTCFRKELANF